MRRSLVRLLAAVLLLTAALLAAISHAASLTVRVESVQVAAGETAEIPITVEGSPGIVAMHLELTYDPAVLEVDAMEPGSFVAGKALTAFNTTAELGRVVISLAAAEEMAGDGTLAVARFKVLGLEGQTSPLGLEYGKAWDEAGFDVVVNTEPGQFTVGPAGFPVPLPLLLAALGVVLLFLLLLGVMRRRQPAVVQQRRGTPATGARPKFCGKCGTPLEVGKQFCTNCGHPVSG